jgi:hypothetical protein
LNRKVKGKCGVEVKKIEEILEGSEKMNQIEKIQANIAPLQPPTLATFRSWGSSAGAGRAGLRCKSTNQKVNNNSNADI